MTPSRPRSEARQWPNLVRMFFDQAERYGEQPFLWAKGEGTYRPLSWRETAARVAALAGGLAAIGVKRGDRVMIVAENRPEWLISDLAIMTAGGIVVPAYTTNTVADYRHILENSGATGAIVSTARLARPLLAAARSASEARFSITMEPLGEGSADGMALFHWDEVLARGEAEAERTVAAASALERSDSACIIYTSGTGGAPRGVMLPHTAILHNCAGATDALEEFGLGEEVYLSFLPLSHSYEHTVGLFFPIFIGAEIYYVESVETLATNMLEVGPTIMTAVPRLFEMLRQRISRGAEKAGGINLALFQRTLELGRKRHLQGGRLGPLDGLTDRVLERLVRDKVRARFGGRLKGMVSGGAPLNPELGLFFKALGLRILQGYGQTEAGPVISVNRPGKEKLHTVGPPLKNTEVRIADDGEILVRGELVMRGYWQNEEATRQAIRDGWLHTGDIGEIDADGHLIITDRKKDIIVNSGGDNLSPARIEGMLTMRPEIAQAMVYGDRRPHVVALIVPDAEWMQRWAHAAEKPADLPALVNDPDFHRALSEVIDTVNRQLSVIERVRRFAIAPQPFSIENEQLTPTLKVRRHIVKRLYGEILEGLYG